MSWEPGALVSSFEKARRKEAYRRLAALIGGKGRDELLSLEEVRQKLRLFDQTYEGIQPIAVEAIVGSAGRPADFDRNFVPINPEVRERWRRIELAFPQGAFPPIVVYRLGQMYFVVDGHHRVAVAKHRGVEFIDAEVTKLHPRFEIPPGADIGHLILLEQARMFMEESGLERARPEAGIQFSRPDGYVELLELVKTHGYHVMVERGEVVPVEEIAADWYDWIYLPTTEAIRRERLSELFPEATEADLFLWIWQRRRALFPERGGMTLEEAVRVTREQEVDARREG